MSVGHIVGAFYVSNTQTATLRRTILMDKLWNICVHEAGHLVMAYLMRISIREIVVRRNTRRYNLSFVRAYVPSDVDPNFTRRYVCVLAAGRAANISFSDGKIKWIHDDDTTAITRMLVRAMLNFDFDGFKKNANVTSTIIKSIRHIREMVLSILQMYTVQKAVNEVATHLYRYDLDNPKLVQVLVAKHCSERHRYVNRLQQGYLKIPYLSGI